MFSGYLIQGILFIALAVWVRPTDRCTIYSVLKEPPESKVVLFL